MQTRTDQNPTLADAPVGNIMTKGVKTVGITDPLVKCIKLMKEFNIGSVIIVEDGKPVGIFTERDLVNKMGERIQSLELTMAQLMSKPLITISSTATVWDALTIMGRRNIRRLPVVDSERLMGIVTERDVFRLILTQQNLLLESVSESFPISTRERLKGIVGVLGIERPPSKMEINQ
jgi:CBS domain-containing protein